MDSSTDSHRLVAEVPREQFIPDVVWVDGPQDRTLVSVTKSENPGRWKDVVSANAPVVTQVDDGHTHPGGRGVLVSSSASQPSVVAGMLDAVDVRPGHEVLEIGTGTGWNAALLQRRVGERGRVVTVEIDPGVAGTAEAALAKAGYRVAVVVGDGADGYLPGAPYDRVLATASVRDVPTAWLAQTRPGGLVVAPWGTDYCNGSLVRLRVAEDGTAQGRFGGYYAFMRLRSQRRLLVVPDGEELDTTIAEKTTTKVTGRDVFNMVSVDQGAFTIGLQVRRCYALYEEDRRGEYHHVVELHDVSSGSWAQVDVDLDHNGEFDVFQFGPRRLWDETLAGYEWWQRHERPDVTRFGMTVTGTEQTVWLDHPTSDNRWTL